jgi:outer membrane immunogenic protein
VVRRFLLCTVALVSIGSPAVAADLPSTRAPAPPPPLPIFSWTGAYIGGQAGYNFGHDTATPAGLGPNGIQPSGVVGGGHIGYNYEAGSSLVVGIEGDIEGSSARSASTAYFGSYTVRSPVQGSIRGRAGFAVDRALFYATGGVAFATFNDSYATGGSASASRAGYTIGGGVEYAISDRWSVRGEYRFSNFGTFTDTLSSVPTTVTHKENQSRAEVGFSYKFAEPVPPVVAKY